MLIHEMDLMDAIKTCLQLLEQNVKIVFCYKAELKYKKGVIEK